MVISAQPAHMRRDDNIRRLPQRMVFWQRLRICHVQRCPPKLVSLQRFDQSSLINNPTSGDVDQQGFLPREYVEFLGGNQVLCLFTVVVCQEEGSPPRVCMGDSR